MTDEHLALRVAGSTAILAGFSWIAWAVLNALTHGQMDAGGPTASPKLIQLGQLLTVSWNLCLIPAALTLWQWLRVQSPHLMMLYTVLGVLSLVFWAYGGATRAINGTLDVAYILLSGVWWLGTGFLLKPQRRAFGTFTTVLGAFAIFDGFISFFDRVPFYLLAPAGLKIPLSNLWAFWVGAILLRRRTTDLAQPSHAAA